MCLFTRLLARWQHLAFAVTGHVTRSKLGRPTVSTPRELARDGYSALALRTSSLQRSDVLVKQSILPIFEK